MPKKKNPHAVALGRRGGLKKAPKGFAAMTPARRREISQRALVARWGKPRKKR
jgi:hypothetical protein